MLKIFDLKTRMKNLFQIILALSALALMPVALAQPVFVHPGISHKKSDLERIKQMVEAQIDPWYSSYQEMAANSKSSYNYVVLGNSTMTELGRDSGVNYGAWNSDIRAAYYNAIRWIVTDDTRHADKAVEIFNAWKNLTSVTSAGTDSLSGGVGYIMIEAAEIIKSTYSGWSASDVQAFKDMLVYPGYSTTSAPSGTKTFYWMSYQGDPGRHGNQGLSGWRTVMAMGIFLDNEIMYERALRYIQGLPHRSDDLAYPPGPRTTNALLSSTDYADTYSTINSTTTADYGYNEVMTHYIWENGQCQESSRDQQHVFFGIGLLCSMAEMAWNQGDDLYSNANDRLLLGLEYNMKHNVSNIRSYPDQTSWWEPAVASGEFIQRLDRTARWFSKAISPDGVGGFPDKRPIFEMPLAHYVGRGLKTAQDVKWTTRARDIAIEESGYEVGGWTNDAIGWGGLTFRRPDYCYGDPISGFSSGLPVYAMNVLPGTLEAENYDYFTTSGEGRTFHDLTMTNTGGQYRPADGVDIADCSEGGHALDSLEAGEWLTYTVAVPSTAQYDISIRYAASQAGGKIKFSFGGVDKTDEVSVPFGGADSTGLTDWKTFKVASGVSLSKGVQSMKVSIAGTSGTFRLNQLSISRDPNVLAAHWKFNETAGTVAADSTGNGYHGTVTSPGWVSGMDGNALNFNGSSTKVTVPSSSFGTISNEISISMWVNGSAQQPVNNSAFYAVAGTTRVLNIHLPYGDSSIYWDAGNSNGYDRINKLAVDSQFKNGWNHWVFTKNASAGTMKIYHNGVLWHSGTGKTKTITGITAATIGSQITGLNYSGNIDDVRLYNVELSDQEIASLYYQAPVFAVGGLVAGSTGETQIGLSWNAAAGATAYNLKRSLTSGGPYTLAVGGLTDPNFVDGGLSTGTTYYYVVNAVYNGVESVQSAEASGVPTPPDTSPVVTTTSLPEGIVGVAYQQTLIATGGNGALTWSIAGGSLPSGISLSGSGILSGMATAAGTATFTVEVADADGDAGTQAFSLIIYNPEDVPVAKFAVGAEDVTASAYQDPNVPGNTLDGLLSTRWSAQGDGQWIRYDLGALKNIHFLKIAWLNGTTRVSNFHVEISDDDTTWTAITGGNLSSSGTTNELETIDVTDYFARYVRIVGHGNSSDNGWNSITELEIWGKPVLPPAVPTGITTTSGNGQVTLIWPASDGAVQYHLKRSTTSVGGFTTIASTTGGSHLDTAVTNGTIYYYTVSAESAAGVSVDSPQANAKPYAPIAPEELVAPAVILSSESMELTVQTVPGRIYQFQRNETLAPEEWEDVGEPVTGTGASIIFADPDAFLIPKCFYRLEIQP